MTSLEDMNLRQKFANLVKKPKLKRSYTIKPKNPQFDYESYHKKFDDL